MKSLFWAAAFVAGFAATASAQSMQHVNSVGQVDRIGKTFSTWKGATTTFRMTDRTVFRVGNTPTSMAALKAGHDVAVSYHVEGTNSIADEVVINN